MKAATAAAAGLAALCMAAGPSPATAATLKAVLLAPTDDARLQRARAERAYLGHPTGLAADGVKMALEDAQFELEADGAAVQLEVREVATAEAARSAAAAAEKAGAAVLLADLPADWLLAATDAVKLPVLNLSSTADRLRAQDCRARLMHLMPSERMRSDALAQSLVSRKWSQVLLLAGQGAVDQTRLASVQASLKRYGLKVVGQRAFKISGDPRERDLANPLLLTAGLTYDVVWVVDSDGEFARSLPYRTVLPRPVVGDAGLVPVAWHAQFERFGAPQVSRRFAKAYNRPMTAHDWTAWMGGKALVAAVGAAPKGNAAAWAKTLRSAELDGSKGTKMTFRDWDGQLRQPLLLTDGQGVISAAPVDGMLHPKNALDTLGADAPEKLCSPR